MILVDQAIAILGREVMPGGTVVERYKGPAVTDAELVDAAAAGAFGVLVLLGEGHLLSEALLDRAVQANVAIAVVPLTNPVDAASRVKEHARALDRTSFAAVRLLSDGLKEWKRGD